MSLRRSRSGGSVHLDDREAVVEILAERRRARPRRADRGSSRRRRARRRLALARRRAACTSPRLEHAQQLRLQRERQLADLVEEQRAAVRLARTRPGDRACAPVKAPRSWPKSSLSTSVSLAAPQSNDDERAALARRSHRERRAPPAPCRCRSRRGAARARPRRCARSSTANTWRIASLAPSIAPNDVAALGGMSTHLLRGQHLDERTSRCAACCPGGTVALRDLRAVEPRAVARPRSVTSKPGVAGHDAHVLARDGGDRRARRRTPDRRRSRRRRRGAGSLPRSPLPLSRRMRRRLGRRIFALAIALVTRWRSIEAELSVLRSAARNEIFLPSTYVTDTLNLGKTLLNIFCATCKVFLQK